MTPAGLAQLKIDEGCELTAYPDPLSGGDPWTIGYGSTGLGIEEGVTWTQPQADNALAAKLAANADELTTAIPWWAQLRDTPRGDVIENMTYNLGVRGLLGFPKTLACGRAGDYAGFATNMLESAWANQVGARAQRLSNLMATGAYPA